MKRHLLRIFSILCCLAMCAGVLASCADTPDEPPISDPIPEPDPIVGDITALDQRASDEGQIIVTYDIPQEATDAYQSFEVRVYHNDTNNNLICSTVVDAAKKTAYVDTTYGKIRLELVGIKDGTATVIGKTTASVWADEYNFASLNGTFPVVYFTLELFSMDGESRDNFKTANAGGKNIQFINNAPTFVSLERVAAYDWSKLPNNVYTLPNTTYEASVSGDFGAMNNVMAAYIKELHEVNPESKFHFYCVDNYPELIVKFFTAQGIEDELFDATMISDGTASVTAFMSLYENGETAEATYTQMKQAWADIKSNAAEGKTDYLENIPNSGGNILCGVLWRYAITMAFESDNIQWWCSRDNFTKNTPSQYMKDLLADNANKNVQYFGINDLLSNLSEEDQAALKELFHFDGEMFGASEEAGKKSLVIIGTSDSGETNLEAYMKLLQELYGDEYVIYYKGHPGYPTGLNSDKTDMFERNGIIDIDASIAAELILFYCPDIYLAGFPSSTYKAALEGKFLSMFDTDKATGIDTATRDGYGDMPDTFYTVVESGARKYVKIENYADTTVKYFDIEAGTILDNLPA